MNVRRRCARICPIGFWSESESEVFSQERDAPLRSKSALRTAKEEAEVVPAIPATDFFTNLSSLRNLIETGSATEVDAVIYRIFYQRPQQLQVRDMNKRPQAKAWGKTGGSSKSSRKQTSSKANGQKGGRPNLDAKTVLATKKLLQNLMLRDHETWAAVTYYQAPPRHLRYLVVLMRDAGLANKDLKLPQEWDEPLRSKSSLRTAKEKAEAIPVRTKLLQLIALQKE